MKLISSEFSSIVQSWLHVSGIIEHSEDLSRSHLTRNCAEMSMKNQPWNPAGFESLSETFPSEMIDWIH